MTDLIDIRDVTAWRGETRVFDRLTLRIAQRECTAILGPNGAGKSTLLKLLSREIYPVAMEGSWVKLFGDESGSVWDLRAHLGIVSGDLQHDYSVAALGLHVVLSGLYSSVGVWQHQEYEPAQIERAHALMHRLGISHLAARPYGSLSTGEQRRFLLGRALINDPDTLVLDEPTSGLDLKAAFQYLDILRDLMRAGKTVVLVTHHLHEIPPEIARVVLLKQGRILADGPKTQILTDARLSDAFDVGLHVVERNGFYQVLPAPSK
jgi:iron complex transport system ATP-binding protein